MHISQRKFMINQHVDSHHPFFQYLIACGYQFDPCCSFLWSWAGGYWLGVCAERCCAGEAVGFVTSWDGRCSSESDAEWEEIWLYALLPVQIWFLIQYANLGQMRDARRLLLKDLEFFQHAWIGVFYPLILVPLIFLDFYYFHRDLWKNWSQNVCDGYLVFNLILEVLTDVDEFQRLV